MPNSAASPAAALEPAPSKHRVFVIDDHGLMRRSIVDALEREPDLAVCGQAEDAPEGLAAIATLRPDLVLTDLQLKSTSGLDLIRQLHAQSPALPVVASTMFNLRRSQRLAFAAGAAGFTSKQEGPEKLIATVRKVLNTIQRQPRPGRPPEPPALYENPSDYRKDEA
jgi:DNA-binding NarL/FixJ family response regulator